MTGTATRRYIRRHERLRRLARAVPGSSRVARSRLLGGSGHSNVNRQATSRAPRQAPYASWIPQGADRRVVVLLGQDDGNLVRQIRRTFRGDVISAVLLGDHPDVSVPGGVQCARADSVKDAARLLLAGGPVDVLVVLDRDPGRRDEAFRSLLFHVRRGGFLIIDRRAGRAEGASRAIPASVERVGAHLLGGARGPDFDADRELVIATGSLVVNRSFVLVQKRARHFAKLRFAESDAWLHERSPEVRMHVLGTLGDGVLQSLSSEVQHESGRPVQFATSMPYPTAHVRAYAGPVTMRSHGLLVSDSTILPDSFRHYARSSLITTNVPRAVDVNAAFARLPKAAPPVRLSGAYYHVDPAVPGHFGHIMGEVMSRLWGWDAAKQRFPGIRAVFSASRRDPGGVLQRRLLTAYGVPPQDILEVAGPVEVETLVSAAPLWHNNRPHHAHPSIVHVWRRLARGLRQPGSATPERMFVSRRSRNRACRNIDEVEALFRELGFTIVYPEDFDLGRQAELFAGATVIAGFGGSAMFNLMFARRLRTLIVLNHEAYTAQNEHLFAAVLGFDAHYFWSRPDVEHPLGGWTNQAFKSPWAFDVDRNRADLVDLMASVPSSRAGQ